MTRYETGRIGEDAVCVYLENLGYEIIVRNYRIKGGEIDIIARNDEYTAFVEVKSRKPNALVSGLEAVNKRKQALIIKTAADFCCKNPDTLQPRFDIAEVTVDNGKILSIDYIFNAYDTTGYNFIF
ncbi:MAG: YraN family protein [Ruminococcus sp.]|nr:YraN family protein [Ruminococcus sp.]